MGDQLSKVRDAIDDVQRAFGAPGDFGYASKEGKALFRLDRLLGEINYMIAMGMSRPVDIITVLRATMEQHGITAEDVQNILDVYAAILEQGDDVATAEIEGVRGVGANIRKMLDGRWEQ